MVRCRSVISEDEDGNEIKDHQELVNLEFQTQAELIAHVTKTLNVDASIVEIEGNTKNMQEQKQDTELHITRRSSWSTFFFICGLINLVVFFVCLFSFLNSILTLEKSPSSDVTQMLFTSYTFIYSVVSLAAAIQSFFMGFLIDVFTDIRWFLSQAITR